MKPVRNCAKPRQHRCNSTIHAQRERANTPRQVRACRQLHERQLRLNIGPARNCDIPTKHQSVEQATATQKHFAPHSVTSSGRTRGVNAGHCETTSKRRSCTPEHTHIKPPCFGEQIFYALLLWSTLPIMTVKREIQQNAHPRFGPLGTVSWDGVMDDASRGTCYFTQNAFISRVILKATIPTWTLVHSVVLSSWPPSAEQSYRLLATMDQMD